MNRKQTEPARGLVPSDFKAVPWVRAVRDAMYEETRDMSSAQFADCIAARVAKVRRESKPS